MFRVNPPRDDGRQPSDNGLSTNGKVPRILDMRVDPVDMDTAESVILDWCHERAARVVCAANVHMVMTAWDDPRFRAVVNSADLVLPDGVPMVWGLRAHGSAVRQRVRVTLDLVDRLLAGAARDDLPVSFYGGSVDTMPLIGRRLTARFPSLTIGDMVVAPFHAPSEAEDRAAVEAIRSAGTRLLFVGIGCPKQEFWMAAHRDALDCVMVGVGAAFDVLAGQTREAPRWTRDIGLEWAYRLALEPRRLGGRYLKQNPRFVYHFGREWMAGALARHATGVER